MARPLAPGNDRRDPGQILVLFALSIVVVLAMAGVAIDAGRFLTQQRFLQNAADAAALAAANAVVQQPSATVASVDQAARDNLAINLAGSTVGAPVVVVPTTPVFDPVSPASGPNLVSGIVLTGGADALLQMNDSADKITDIRVALRGPVDYMFGGVVGLGQSIVSVHAHVGFQGNLMPVAVRRYINVGGPYTGTVGSCRNPPDENKFADLAATQATSCSGTADQNPLGYGQRTPASREQPGPTTVLIGQGAQSSNASDFRGFINLDIRNFNDLNSRVYCNNVPSGANTNTLKDFEAGWIPHGYPGPDFPPVINPPAPDDQVAIMDGNSSGLVVNDLDTRWNVGDKILCALYDGTVMSIPDFSMTAPSGITLPAGTPVSSAARISVKPNNNFTGTVTVSAPEAKAIPKRPSWLTPTFAPSGQFAPDHPQGTDVTLSATVDSGTQPQVDMLWVQGHSEILHSPLKDHYAPIAVTVGDLTRDFTLVVSPNQAPTDPGTGATAWGNPVTFTATVTVRNPLDFPDGIAVSLEPVGAIDASWSVPFPDIAAGSFGFSNATITTWSGQGNTFTGTATFTINTTQLGVQGTYDYVLTAQGWNQDHLSVRRQAAGQVLSQATSNNSNYIDITGFAVYRITAIDSNSMTGEAISPVFATASDSGLRAALTPRLRPW